MPNLSHSSLIIAVALWTAGAAAAQSAQLPSVQEMIAAKTDVWGEAAIRQPDGPSYEFFRGLLPPLRYANTEFRFYPIVLSAPRAAVKCRFVGNGSGINLQAKKPPMWHEAGQSVKFCVGQPAELFGSDLKRLDGPRYCEGHLPIVNVAYRVGALTYRQEAFAPVEPAYAQGGAVMVRFTAVGTAEGRVEARVEPGKPVREGSGQLLDEEGHVLIGFGTNWRWEPVSRILVGSLAARASLELVVFTQPTGSPIPTLSAAAYDEQRTACVTTWQALLTAGMQLQTPEKVVNDAWRSTLIGNFMIADGDRMNYSTGNAYAKLYQGECGDSLLSLLLYGQDTTARSVLRPIMEFYREATRFHVAGQKLQLLTQYYWMTRDAGAVRANEDMWRRSLDLILNNREPGSGLLPKDNYAGDISEQVYSLNSNANCWRGMRDLAVVLDELGDHDESRRLLGVAAEYRKAILAAVEKSERRGTQPPFIPVALLADEPAHDPLTSNRIGSYYDLMAPYIIGSGVFGPGNEREEWLIRYLQQHGGISMGMVRTEPHQGEFNGYHGVVPLYGLRYLLALLRRDEVDQALVGFYGQLAQGMTPDTYIGGEGTRFLHGDADGRTMYLPPNSTNNATFLLTLRYLLVQDWDLDDDGRPETLRLLYGVPRRWLGDGQRITLRDAPTAFGKVSLEVESRLSAGEVRVSLTAPPRAPRQVSIRVPLPAGWKATTARIEETQVPVQADGSVDLSSHKGNCLIRVAVARQPAE